MVDYFDKLPKNWALPSVSEVGSIRLGRQLSPDKHTGRYSTKYLRAGNITSNGLDLTDLFEMDFSPKERAVFELQLGDVVLAEASGSPSQVGRSATWLNQVPNCCFQNTVVRFRPHATTSRYAELVFRFFAKSGIFARTARGVGIQHLGASRLANLRFPLPPLEEQTRISEVLERKLSEIQKAEKSLSSALKQTVIQDNEILRAAVTGELSPSKNSGESIERKSAESNLPPSWVLARVDEIGEVTLGRQRSPKQHRGKHMRPYLRVANVFEDRIDVSDVLRMNFTPKEFQRYELKFGDILLNEGQSPELVGRPAMYRHEVPGACFQNTLIRFRAGPSVNADYALLVFRHYLRTGEFRKIARWSTNIAHLGVDRFRSMLFPLPSITEQEKIVEAANARLENSASQREIILRSLNRMPEVEQQLLSAAVTGQLVNQLDADEPAAALLERVGPPVESLVFSEASLAREESEVAVQKRRKSPVKDNRILSLSEILRSAKKPLAIPELFSLAGYDRDQPEHVERFYLALRSELGRTVRIAKERKENALLEAINAPR